jgi:sec-independent protein translocase protein TatA
MALSLLVLGTPEIIVIVLAVVVLFGATRVPQLMRGLGQGIKEFKQAVKEDPAGESEQEQTAKPADPKP